MVSVRVRPRARWGALIVVLFLCGLVVALGAQPVLAAPTCTTDCYVDVALGDDTNSGTAAGAGNALKTIQAAVNQVNAGGNVHVADGTYPETVAVNKAVTITGNGPTLTTVDPAAGNAFNITAGSVTIEDLKITDAAQGARLSGAISQIIFDNVHFVNNTSRGIEMQNGAGPLISNVQVLNSLFDNNGTGMRMSSNTTADGITIDNTTFQNHAGSGFYQANDGNTGWVKNLTVQNSTFTNNGASSGHAGVYAEEFSNVLIEDSTFTGNLFGINLFDFYSAAASVTTNVTIQNNTFTDHKSSTMALRSTTSDPNAQLFLIDNNTINEDVGVLVGAAQAHIAVTTTTASVNGAVDVVNNTLTFSGLFPSGILATYGVYLAGGLDDVNVEGNTIDGGSVGTNGAAIPSSGVRIATSIFQTNADITVTKNLINNFVNGVSIHDGSNTMGGIQPNSLVKVNRNDLSANTSYGFQSGPATESDGTCNWWGAADGPSGEGPGMGTAVSTDVDFTPWLYSDDLDGECYIGGTITIVKEAVGGELVDFTFDVSWSGDNVVLKGGESYVTDPPLPEGNYSITEINLPTGWSQQSATCEGPDNITADPSSINIFDNFEWTCTFTNVYTPPSTCPATGAGSTWTDILGIGMGNPKKHKVTAKLVIPNAGDVSSLYGQLVAKNTGFANYVRFMYPGVNNFVQVNTITSPAAHSGGNFWYGTYLNTAPNIRGRWFLQPSGAKNHIPRAFVLYPTYEDPVNTYVNVWDTFDPAETEVDYKAIGWVAGRQVIVPIAPNAAATTFHVEVAVTDNDKDAREVWVTVTAGSVSQTVKQKNSNKGDQLSILEFDLAGVPAGADEIVIDIYSPSPALDGVTGDSAMVIGMAAHYQCLAVTIP